MEKQKVTLDRSMLAGIEAVREILQATAFNDKKLRLVKVDITAEQSRPGDEGDGYDKHRNMQISVVVQHEPFGLNWATFHAECEVSLPNGLHEDFWKPRTVKLRWAGSQWNRTATYHENNVLEINADNSIKIFV